MSARAAEHARAIAAAVETAEGETGVPAFLAEEPATRAWLEVFEHGSRTRGWHPSDVEWALAHAHKLMRRLGGRVGPKGAAGFWPPLLQEDGEAYSPRRISAGEVSSVNAAVGWAWEFLAPAKGGEDRHEKERRAIQAWAYCKEYGLSHAAFMRQKGLTKATEQLRRRRGMLLIAGALCRAERPIPREVLLARLERARSEVRGDQGDELALAAQAGELQAAAAAGPDAEAPMPLLIVIDGMWRNVELCSLLAPEARGPAVFALIAERVLLEASCGLLSAPGALERRTSDLQAEAVRRGFLAEGERRAGALSREELTARIKSKRDAQ